MKIGAQNTFDNNIFRKLVTFYRKAVKKTYGCQGNTISMSKVMIFIAVFFETGIRSGKYILDVMVKRGNSMMIN